jgi:hypothetical protein
MTKIADTIDEIFEDIWRKRNAPVPEKPPLEECVHYQQFAAWANKKCQEVIRNPSPVALNRTLFLVFLKYMEWRNQVTKRHRNQIGERGHRCIFHVLESSYYQLIAIGLDQFEPPLYEPAPPSSAPTKVVKVYKIDSFPIGVVEDDDEGEDE